MARHKDSVWSLAEKPTIEGASLGVLMDIRDELKDLNRKMGRLEAIFQCRNFQLMPGTINRIARNTAPKRKVR